MGGAIVPNCARRHASARENSRPWRFIGCVQYECEECHWIFGWLLLVSLGGNLSLAAGACITRCITTNEFRRRVMSFSISKRLLAVVVGLSLSVAVGAAPVTFITIGSGSTSGLYYPTAVGIAKIINEADIDVRANARSTGASVFNANAIGQGALQMGMMQNNIAY